MNRNVVVTASTKGIGYAIAKKFLENGDKVILNYSTDDSVLEKIQEDLKNYEGKYKIIKEDLSTIKNIDNFYENIKKFFLNIDVLVLNAAVTNRKELAEITYEEYIKVMDINLNMPFYLVKKIQKNMKKNSNIIFIGAVMGLYPHAISIPYAVSKAGVKMLAESLVKFFSDRKIRVNTIAPGFIDTPWQKNKEIEHRRRIENKIALRRFGLSEEVANLCYHVVENDYINGATLKIDGGYNME